MSMQDLAAFSAALAADKALEDELKTAIGQSTGDEACAATARFAAAKGYDVSADELKTGAAELAGGREELTEAELETVSGGLFGWPWWYPLVFQSGKPKSKPKP